ncbi:hypothetical protein [Nocardia takedensis]|uniref:hypothetical protein n=1 Tax=Nocardia takedensis TaxID=259390 RepID=UPI0005928EE8|nr:hypothetical protein [Nocardia takedensis]
MTTITRAQRLEVLRQANQTWRFIRMLPDFTRYLPPDWALPAADSFAATAAFRQYVDGLPQLAHLAPPSWLTPAVDPAAAFRAFDATRFIDMSAITSILPVLEEPLTLGGIGVPLPPNLLPPDFDELILRALSRRIPDNWPDSEAMALPLERAREIAEDEGIPIVYVPRAAIVAELLEAANRHERAAILVNRTDAILDDCFDALDWELAPAVSAVAPLLLESIATMREGHHSAAMALATCVFDTLLGGAFGKHNKARSRCRVQNLASAGAKDRLRYVLAVAPVVRALTDWSPEDPRQLPRPAEYSRHVTVHQAHPDHFTPENAVLAVMVATSLMRALDERSHWANPHATR